jgi:hypothetical protein
MTTQEAKRRKGFFGAIWESMTKTGGCCGSDGDCCGSSNKSKGKEEQSKKVDVPKKIEESCCGS